MRTIRSPYINSVVAWANPRHVSRRRPAVTRVKVMDYDEAEAVVRYVWRHCAHLLTDLERRTAEAIVGREKAAAALRLGSPQMAQTISARWGCRGDPAVDAALVDGA